MKNTNFVAEPGKQEIIVTTVFDAPRELVFETSTDPNLIMKWWMYSKFLLLMKHYKPLKKD